MIEKMGKGLKIFLLDDEEDICYFFKEVLVRRGFEVQMAMTGTAAVDVIKNFLISSQRPKIFWPSSGGMASGFADTT